MIVLLYSAVIIILFRNNLSAFEPFMGKVNQSIYFIARVHTTHTFILYVFGRCSSITHEWYIYIDVSTQLCAVRVCYEQIHIIFLSMATMVHHTTHDIKLRICIDLHYYQQKHCIRFVQCTNVH